MVNLYVIVTSKTCHNNFGATLEYGGIEENNTTRGKYPVMTLGIDIRKNGQPLGMSLA